MPAHAGMVWCVPCLARVDLVENKYFVHEQYLESKASLFALFCSALLYFACFVVLLSASSARVSSYSSHQKLDLGPWIPNPQTSRTSKNTNTNYCLGTVPYRTLPTLLYPRFELIYPSNPNLTYKLLSLDSPCRLSGTAANCDL